jgi:hypothetical protein
MFARNKFTNRVRFTLWTFLIALSVILRYSSTPHEIGWDTFTIQALANSISEFGWARWWVNLLSIGGFYPCSYASSVPFLVSGMSQCTSIDMEWTVWLFCTLTGIFTIFFAYILAGAIRDNDLFKFLVAFGYSTAPGVLGLSMWVLSTRGLLIVLLPLFIYLLLKTRDSLKYLPLVIILFMVLVVTHHLFYFTIPVIFSYVAAILLYRLKGHIKVKIPDFANIAFVGFFVIMLLIPFFTRMFISETGTRYIWYELIMKTYVRTVGMLLIFAVGGLIYLLLKQGKTFEEGFLMLSLICLTPFLFIYRYTKSFAIVFAIILAGISLTNVVKAHDKRAKCVFAIIVITLLLSISFSAFYQHYHTNIEGRPTYNERYMEDGTYVAALWIKDNIDRDKIVVGDDDLIARRIFAVSEVPTLTGSDSVDLTYGLTKITEIKISNNSPLSTAFYMDGPYVRTPRTPYTGFYRCMLNTVEFDSGWGRKIITRYNLSYVMENEDVGDNTFIRSVHQEKDSIYDNAKIQIWCLDCN